MKRPDLLGFTHYGVEHMHTIFFSWQADCPNSTNRGFIEDCLERAIKELSAQGTLTVETCIDRDTRGVPGSPDIANSILEKIDQCSMFVADVSFINDKDKLHTPDLPADRCICTRLTPNPNVLTECGYAAHSITFDRVLLVLNTHTGKIEDLPFDLRPRRIVDYELANGQEKTEVRKQLVRELKSAIQDIMQIPRTQFNLEFADYSTRQGSGKEFSLKGKYLDLNDAEVDKIPDFAEYRPGTQRHKFGGHEIVIPDLSSMMPMSRKANRHYYREAFNHLFVTNLYQPFRLMIENQGAKTLEHVRVVLKVPDEQARVLSSHEYNKCTEVPEKYYNSMDMVPNVRDTYDADNVEKIDSSYQITIEFRRLHREDVDFSPTFYFAARNGSDTKITGRVFADHTAPQDVELTIHFDIDIEETTLDAIDEKIRGSQTQKQNEDDEDDDE